MTENEGETTVTLFNDLAESYTPKLELYTLPVTRAHGKRHPEVFAVHELFQELNEMRKESVALNAEYGRIFKELREVTKNYSIPADACETYEAVYVMLQEMDEAHQQQKN